MIRVLLAEDHAVVRAGLAQLLTARATSRSSAPPPTARRPSFSPTTTRRT